MPNKRLEELRQAIRGLKINTAEWVLLSRAFFDLETDNTGQIVFYTGMMVGKDGKIGVWKE